MRNKCDAGWCFVSSRIVLAGGNPRRRKGQTRISPLASTREARRDRFRRGHGPWIHQVRPEPLAEVSGRSTGRPSALTRAEGKGAEFFCDSKPVFFRDSDEVDATRATTARRTHARIDTLGMEEVTVKVEAGIQPPGRPIVESAESHEGEEGRLKAEAAKGHDQDKTAGAPEHAADGSEDDEDDDADYKIVKTDPENPTTAAVQSPSEGDRGNVSDQAPARSDPDGAEDEDEDVEGEEEEEEDIDDDDDDEDNDDDDGHGEEEEDDTEDAEANLTNLSDLALIAGAANGRAKPKPKPKSADKDKGGRPAKRRPLRSASEITQEELSSCFHLPSEAACRKLGIGLTVLKRQCRKFGIKRWPFRKMKSLDRLITNVQAGISPGDQNRTLVKSVEELEEQKRRMEECQVLDLDENTKRLQQAYSKANHKARRMAQAPELGGLGGLLALSSKSDKRGSDASTAGVARGDDDHVNSVMSSVLKRAKAGAQILDVAGAIPVLGDPAATITAAANAIQEYSGTRYSTLLPSTFTGLNPTQQNILAALASAMNSKEPGDRSSISAFTTALTNLAAQGKIEVQPEAVAAWQNAAKFYPPQGALTTTTTTTQQQQQQQQQQRPSDAATNPFAPALDPADLDLVDGRGRPVTAVTGRWSPARPARKFDADGKPVLDDRGTEILEELLAQRGKRGRPPKNEPESEEESSESESSESESEEESEEEPEPNEEVEGEAGRSGRRRKPNPKYQDEKTPKKKKKKKKKKEKKEKKKRAKRARTNSAGGKGGDVDDADPLASLALAALGAAKTAKPAKASAVPAEHPAFALAQQKSRTVVSRAPAGAGLFAPRVDKSTITLVVTEHADRLREAMLTLAEGGARRWPREGPDAPASQDEKQAISDAIGVEALKLRDALNEMLLPQGLGRP